ncbi:MAG: single-stranded-DNA-specific exonuclease RecJ [Gloeocapsa sp. DLM2.Bin57]|nr:MAG: single-stranded-DNA-specific exonuclease RecJ [Gloeocapsa sp. DLM2.Bin57]
MSKFVWELSQPSTTSRELRELVKTYLPESEGIFAAKLLQQRGITPETAVSFLSPDKYQPTPPNAFGQEIKLAINRLQQAIACSEKVTIWGDFNPDGVMATILLYSGLGKFWGDYLDYYLPSRLEAFHGLNKSGITKLAKQEVKVIITCGIGSTNLTEINYAQELGIDLIIIDHHTPPEDRPEVVSILNPRYFIETHPLYHLSAVAIAYKLLEGFYLTCQQTSPPESLLDLVGIGLICDQVELKGDCRYLAQKGLQQLPKQNNPKTATRLGLYYLLQKCQQSGDRPTDISYGIGARINAVSRIYHDSNLLVQLLTEKDSKKCQKLAHEVELANARRKELEKNTLSQIKAKLVFIDLSTTSVIVLADSRWEVGVLALIVNTIAREYNRPTILLSIEQEIARGLGSTLNNLDLDELIKSQIKLLTGFSGDTSAVSLTLPVANIDLFTAAINQVARRKIDNFKDPTLAIDLVITVKELGRNLFKELKLLEPFGIGNHPPKLLLKKCIFTEIKTSNIKDCGSQNIRYQKTTFFIQDKSTQNKFPGVWWGHSSHELPTDTYCDLVVELDYSYNISQYEVRLIDWQPTGENNYYQLNNDLGLLDWRNQPQQPQQSDILTLNQCPSYWSDITQSYQEAKEKGQQLALAYHQPTQTQAIDIWYQLIGIAKYLHRTGKSVTYQQIQTKLQISDRTLKLGLETLSHLGYIITYSEEGLQITSHQQSTLIPQKYLDSFLETLTEELFQQQYFNQVPLNIIQNFTISLI